MSGLEPIIKAVFGNAFSVFLRIVGYTLFGVVLNIILLAVQWKLILSLFLETSEPEEMAAGAAVLAMIVLAPVVFFILGQKQGIQNLLSNILKSKKYDVIFWLVNRLQVYKPEIFHRGGEVKVTTLRVMEYTTEVLRDLPSVIVKTMKYFTKKVEFSEKFSAAIEEAESDRDIDSFSVEKVSRIISNMIPGDVIEPSIKLPFLLLCVNVSFFFL